MMLDPQSAAEADQNALSRSLRPRHVAMITIGGIIGAGLFVGSGVAIAAAGPAIIISYAITGLLILLIMRMLGEMAVDMPHVRSFTEFTRAGLIHPYASEFMAAVILTAVLSCLNSSFYVASRVLFVLAGRGDAPCWLVKTNARHVPARAVVLASAVGFAGVVAAIFSPSVVFAFLVNASGAIIAIIYLLIGVSQVRTRRARERAGRPPPTLPMWLFPWLSYVAIVGMFTVLIAMALTPSHRAEFWASTISIAVTLLAYRIFRYDRGGGS